MLIDDRVMNGQERISFMLRSLYSQHGYERYRMSKFEEYDLYSRNKDFLFSEGVITFTDTTGRLMALKPDVTLSIVKNRKDTPGSLQKLYYHENVYRVSGAADGDKLRQIFAAFAIFEIAENHFSSPEALISPMRLSTASLMAAKVCV